MLWAGRSFDSDAKRWRFRSSLLYAGGSTLEVLTFACPPLFLLFATLATCLKQISMLTSTATRNAIYRSFTAVRDLRPEGAGRRSSSARSRRGTTREQSGFKRNETVASPSGRPRTSAFAHSRPSLSPPLSHPPHAPPLAQADTKSDNIGDITAKGEAQIAIIDLLGMIVGIVAARFVIPALTAGAAGGDAARGVVFPRIFALYLSLCALDVFAIYREIRAVVFSRLNHEVRTEVAPARISSLERRKE